MVDYLETFCQVPDFGDRPLDADPNFGWYWNFCSTIINVRTDRNSCKEVHINSSDKYAVLSIGYVFKLLFLKRYW